MSTRKCEALLSGLGCLVGEELTRQRWAWMSSQACIAARDRTTGGAARAGAARAAAGEGGEGGETAALRTALRVARIVGGAQQRLRHLAAAASLVDVNNDGDGDGERRWATLGLGLGLGLANQP